MDNKKLKIWFILIIVFIIALIVYGIYLLLNNSNVVLDKSKDIVYTYYENSDYNQQIPNINVKKISEQVNSSIMDFTNNYKDNKTCSISYHYQVSGNILSLFIEVEDSKYEGASDVSFKSYIINLKKLKLLTDDEVLKLFDLDKEIVVKAIDDKFKNYYQEEINKNIINSKITYQEYMNKRGISNLENNLYLDINDSKLNVYVDYNAFLAEEKQFYLSDVGYAFEFN